MPLQSLPSNIMFSYAYFDGTDTLNAIPVKTTAHSQSCDFVVFNKDGTSSVKTGVHHQSSGDDRYWVIAGAAGTMTPTS